MGSRASKLARAQVTEWLTPLADRFPSVRFKREIILEGGDQDRVTPTLAEVARAVGGSAFSTNQEEALVSGRVDVIVHSLKDLPTAAYEGTTLLTMPGPREDVRDVLCGATLDELPRGARVGTGAPRCVAQPLALRPDLKVVPIRGNVPGRLARVKGQDRLHAVVLAAAGLNRLGLTPEVHEVLDPDVFPPSPGQGALGIQVRTESSAARRAGRHRPGRTILISPGLDISLTDPRIALLEDHDPWLAVPGTRHAGDLYRGALPTDHPHVSPSCRSQKAARSRTSTHQGDTPYSAVIRSTPVVVPCSTTRPGAMLPTIWSVSKMKPAPR
ncbi:hydroxymethylbilane synthase [Streptomyces tanashiensis]